MPKGTKIVDWTPENEAKLFHTIIAVHDIKVDNAKVAEAFGPNVPASCIVTKMAALRKKAASMSVIPSSIPANGAGSTSAPPVKGKKQAASKSNGGDESMADVEDQTVNEEGDLAQGATPPGSSDEKVAGITANNKVITGKVKKPRAPRKNVKKNVKKLADIIAENDDFKDENVKDVSGAPDEAGNEDSAHTAVEEEDVKHEA